MKMEINNCRSSEIQHFKYLYLCILIASGTRHLYFKLIYGYIERRTSSLSQGFSEEDGKNQDSLSPSIVATIAIF